LQNRTAHAGWLFRRSGLTRSCESQSRSCCRRRPCAGA
jgi:hypothetical protein